MGNERRERFRGWEAVSFEGYVTAPNRRWVGFGLLVAFVLGLSSCGDIATEPDAEGALEVSAVDPAEGEQGETLEVRIFGEGFDDGVVATWERAGVPDQLIAVQRLVVVSDTELLATISIAREADVAAYDVVVSRNRKRGIGSEIQKATAVAAFRVTEFIPSLVATVVQGDLTFGTGINDLGWMVGTHTGGHANMNNPPRATYWTPNGAINQFGGHGRMSEATGINNRGWIVGWDTGLGGDPEDPDNRIAGFIYEDRFMIRLLPPEAFVTHTFAHAINDAGTIVGKAGFGLDDVPVVWHRRPDGTYGAGTFLPPRPEQTWGEGDWIGRAVAINGRGDIAGTIQNRREPRVIPVLWRARPDATYEAPMELGEHSGFARGINDAGWVVGELTSKDHSPVLIAVLWHPDDYSKSIELGSGYAFDVNNSGWVAGGGSHRTGQVWSLNQRGEVMAVFRLPSAPGFEVSQARAINSDGWVVGTSSGTRETGQQTTVWKPDE